MHHSRFFLRISTCTLLIVLASWLAFGGVASAHSLGRTQPQPPPPGQDGCEPDPPGESYPPIQVLAWADLSNFPPPRVRISIDPCTIDFLLNGGDASQIWVDEFGPLPLDLLFTTPGIAAHPSIIAIQAYLAVHAQDLFATSVACPTPYSALTVTTDVSNLAAAVLERHPLLGVPLAHSTYTGAICRWAAGARDAR